MKKLVSLTSAAGLALLVALTATASTVNRNFQVTNAANAVVGSGSYSYNDAAGAANVFGETEFQLTAFSFTFDGNNFSLLDLDGGKGLVLLGAGNQLLGLEAYRSTGTPFSFVPGAAGSEDFFVYGTGARARAFDVNAAATVPAPGTLWLALGLLPLAGWFVRRRRASAD